MVYGVAIDNNFLKLMSEYRDKNDSDITASDRGMVAMQQINVYKEKATKGLDEMHAEFGAGITVMSRIYNATGDRIKVHLTKDWLGQFFKGAPEVYVENGQWAIFMHTKPWAVPDGSTGAVVYRTASGSDIFIGWRNPWGIFLGPAICLTEVRPENYWWNTRSASDMKDLLLSNGDGRCEKSGYGYKVSACIGNTTASFLEVIIERV